MLDVAITGQAERNAIFASASDADKLDQVKFGVALTSAVAQLPSCHRGYVLELVVTVRTGGTAAYEAENSVDMQEAQNTAASKSTIIGGTSYSIGGFASPEAAVDAAHAMVEWCCRWSNSQGRPAAERVDKGTNTGEAQCLTCARCTAMFSSMTRESCEPLRDPSVCSYERLCCPNLGSVSAAVSISSSHAPDYNHTGACSSQTSMACDISVSPLSPDSSRHQSKQSGIGVPVSYGSAGPQTRGVWSSEGPKDRDKEKEKERDPHNRLICHRDSFDLQSNHSGRSFQSSRFQEFKHRKGSKMFKEAVCNYKEAKSKIFGVFQSQSRGQDEASNGDPSDDDIDMRRWSTLSEARETALLNKEPKSLFARHGRLPFRTFSTREAIKKAPKCFGVSSASTNRSYTPPPHSNRSGEYAASDSAPQAVRRQHSLRSNDCQPRRTESYGSANGSLWPKLPSPRERSPCRMSSLVSNLSNERGQSANRAPVMIGVLDMNGVDSEKEGA